MTTDTSDRATSTVAYDPLLARTFANAVQVAYAHYDDPSTPIVLDGYTIGASIHVFEGTATFFGFVASGAPRGSGRPPHNLVVLRGTRSVTEVSDDLAWTPVSLTIHDVSCGRVASGQRSFYFESGVFGRSSLSASLLAAVGGLADQTLPLYICGHSLGGGIATLAALDIALSGAYRAARPVLYTFGGLHVGDSGFAGVFAANVAAAFRVVNLADFVPQLTGLTEDQSTYVHVGEQWWFASYRPYLWQNHELSVSYLAAVTASPSPITNTAPPQLGTSG